MTTIEAFELMQSVLAYYASSNSWEVYLDGDGNHGTECDATANDRGRRARQVLKQLEALELEPLLNCRSKFVFTPINQNTVR